VLSEDRPDEDLARLAAQLGRLLFFMGEPERAAERIEQALEMAESLTLPEVLSQALNTKGVILITARGRPEEGLALLRHALAVGLDSGVPSAALRAYYNLSNLLYYRDRYDSSLEYTRDGLALARRFGDRNWEWSLLGGAVAALFLRGDWDEALARADEIPHLEDFEATEEVTQVRFAAVELLVAIPMIHLARGHVTEADQVVRQFAAFRDSADVQERTAYAAAAGAVARRQGRLEDALASGLQAFEGRAGLGASSFYTKLGFVEAAEAAFELGELKRVENLLDIVGEFGAGDMTPFLGAQSSRFAGRLAGARDDAESAEREFRAATALSREIEVPFWLAVTQLEHAEWLIKQGRAEEAEPLLAEARETFERLEATPWVDRAAQASPAGREPEAVTGRS